MIEDKIPQKNKYIMMTSVFSLDPLACEFQICSILLLAGGTDKSRYPLLIESLQSSMTTSNN